MSDDMHAPDFTPTENVNPDKLDARSVSALDLQAAALRDVMRCAELALKNAIVEGADRFQVDAWNRRQRRALPIVKAAFEARGFHVRRRYPPLRWMLDGLIVSLYARGASKP